MISKHSKQPEATYLFLQWMVEKSTQQQLLRQVGRRRRAHPQQHVVAARRQGVAVRPALRRDAREPQVRSAKPKAPKIYEMMDVLVGLVQEVGLGRKTAEQALKEGQEKVLAICAKCTL